MNTSDTENSNEWEDKTDDSNSQSLTSKNNDDHFTHELTNENIREIEKIVETCVGLPLSTSEISSQPLNPIKNSDLSALLPSTTESFEFLHNFSPSCVGLPPPVCDPSVNNSPRSTISDNSLSSKNENLDFLSQTLKSYSENKFLKNKTKFQSDQNLYTKNQRNYLSSDILSSELINDPECTGKEVNFNFTDGSSNNDALLNILSSNMASYPDFNSLDSLKKTIASYRYENTIIKTELAETIKKHNKELNELKMKYQILLEQENQDKIEQINVISQAKEQSSLDQRKLHQSNLHLAQKLKLCEDDIESLNSVIDKLEKEKKELQNKFDHNKNTDFNTIQTLKVELKTLTDQIDHFKSELEKEKILTRELTTTLRSEKHQSHMMKNKMNEAEKTSEVKVASVKSEIDQLKSLHERECERLNKQISELQSTLEEGRDEERRNQEKNYIKVRELEFSISEYKQQIIKTKSDQLQEITKLQQNIKVLETKLNSLSSSKEKEILKLQEEISSLKDKLYKEQTEKAITQGRIGILSELEDSLKREREEASLLRQKISQLRGELESILENNSKLQTQLQQEKFKLSDAEIKLKKCLDDKSSNNNNTDRIIADMKIRHQEELSQVRSRVASLETQLTDKGHQYLDETTALKQKVKTYGQLIKKLRHKLQLSTLREEQLTAQQSVLEENVPPHHHRKVQQQLLDLTRKHAEFAAFIKGLGDFQNNIPHMSDLNDKVNAISQKLADLEESQLNCFSEVESL